ncbi:hypothetical protein ES703_117304 [subsurface metagenome]
MKDNLATVPGNHGVPPVFKVHKMNETDTDIYDKHAVLPIHVNAVWFYNELGLLTYKGLHQPLPQALLHYGGIKVFKLPDPSDPGRAWRGRPHEFNTRLFHYLLGVFWPAPAKAIG